MVRSEATPISVHPKFRRRKPPVEEKLLKHITNVVLKPNRSYFIRDFLKQDLLIKILPGLRAFMSDPRFEPVQKARVCSIDLYTLTRPGSDREITIELGLGHRVNFWMLIHLISRQLHGEEGVLPTNGQTIIAYGGENLVYTLRYWQSFWYLNIKDGHAARRAKDSCVLGAGKMVRLH